MIDKVTKKQNTLTSDSIPSSPGMKQMKSRPGASDDEGSPNKVPLSEADSIFDDIHQVGSPLHKEFTLKGRDLKDGGNLENV